MRKIELLAPGGDVDSIKAAIAAGADAVYCGISRFNARNRASNIDLKDLNGILRLAHGNSCQVFLTLNILITEPEFPELVRLLNRLTDTSIDGIIIQDLGLFYLLSNYYPELIIHASTQLTTHNRGQVLFLSKLNASRVNLSRELNLKEIESLSRIARENNLLSEVFVHGSYCISFSGLCYMSSVQGGNSGNRGRCSQPCRDQYRKTPSGSEFPLNLKDNSAWSGLKELTEAGVDSIKVEGRMKKYHYVYSVVNAYRSQLQRLYAGKEICHDDKSLRKTFNRGFSMGFLKGEIGRDMFNENPRDQSVTTPSEFEEAKSLVKKIIDQLSIEKAPLQLYVSGKAGSPLEMLIKTPDASREFVSEKKLTRRGRWSLDNKELMKRFKALNESEYFIEKVELENLQPDLQLPSSEITHLKNRILFFLRDSREARKPVTLPVLTRAETRTETRTETGADKNNGTTAGNPVLSVLISSKHDLRLCDDMQGDIYFLLPESFPNDTTGLVALFGKTRKLTPWFPAVLIDKDFEAATGFLDQLRPSGIVTDNTGIAYEAHRLGIPWIAGPRLNLVNSYSLLALKEKFNCAGAFISNELNRQQIRKIKRPEDFRLCYSIYHPVELMTSRQCFFQQVTSCKKEKMDQDCLPDCRKSASITNQRKEELFIQKEAGSYNRIYGGENFLNTDIQSDIPGIFTDFLIDLRDIKTHTRMKMDKQKIIELFENHLTGLPGSAEKLAQAIAPTSQAQYLTGI